jgi:hypothetical protein
MLIILVITVNAFKNAPTVDDFEEPYDYSKSKNRGARSIKYNYI